MTNVRHYFVDSDSKTHIDEFTVNYKASPFPVGDVDVVMPTRWSADLLRDTYMAAQSAGRHVFLACPFGKRDSSFDDAKLAVRQLVFDKLPGHLGGLRPAGERDFTNAAFVSAAKAFDAKLERDWGSRIKEAQKLKNPAQWMALEKAIDAATKDERKRILCCASGHGLHKRVSLVKGLPVMWSAVLALMLVDPTWYVDPEDSTDLTSFFAATHPETTEHASAVCLCVGITEAFTRTADAACSGSGVTDPGLYFTRYALGWQQAQDVDVDDMSVLRMYRGCVAVYARKLLCYVFGGWMEWLHPDCSSVTFDEARFFVGDKAAAAQSYRLATG